MRQTRSNRCRLEAAKTVFKNQAVALDHWERATADRLTGLAEENQEVVVQALDAQLAVLRRQVSEERPGRG
jgi:vacuolar-type H+-ATPase subunit E/Vma4